MHAWEDNILQNWLQSRKKNRFPLSELRLEREKFRLFIGYIAIHLHGYIARERERASERERQPAKTDRQRQR